MYSSSWNAFLSGSEFLKALYLALPLVRESQASWVRRERMPIPCTGAQTFTSQGYCAGASFHPGRILQHRQIKRLRDPAAVDFRGTCFAYYLTAWSLLVQWNGRGRG